MTKQQKEARDKFYKNMKIYHNEIELLGEYVKSAEKIKCKCKKCGNIWLSSPNNLISNDKNGLRLRGCPNCANYVKPRTRDEIIKDLHDDYDKCFEFLNEYKNDTEKLKLKCKKCNSIYERLIGSLKDKAFKCCNCENDNRLILYKEKLKVINKNVICTATKYNGYKTKIEHYCTIHEKYFYIDPCHALRGQGCDECKYEKIIKKKTKSNDKYLEELNKVNKDIYPIEDYVKCSVPILHKCKICGYEWKAMPSNLIKSNHTGCPNCKVRSNGEKEIKDILDNYKIDYIQEFRFDDCRSKKPLPFDFAIFKNDKMLLLKIGRAHV